MMEKFCVVVGSAFLGVKFPTRPTGAWESLLGDEPVALTPQAQTESFQEVFGCSTSEIIAR